MMHGPININLRMLATESVLVYSLLVHSERPELYTILAFLDEIMLKKQLFIVRFAFLHYEDELLKQRLCSPAHLEVNLFLLV